MIIEIDDYKTINGRYPHIGSRLSELWGKVEFSDYVQNMIGRSSGAGFPQDIVQCMKNLLVLHEEQFKPHEDAVPLQPKKSDPADNEHLKLVSDQYPRVGEQLRNKWASRDFSPYVNELLNDTRDGKRTGFPPAVAHAIFSLMMQHDREFPEFEIKVNDIWSLHDDGTQGR
jgi:hypothetical protein